MSLFEETTLVLEQGYRRRVHRRHRREALDTVDRVCPRIRVQEEGEWKGVPSP